MMTFLLNGESFNGLAQYESMPLVEWQQLHDVYAEVQRLKAEQIEKARR